jgi:outer membrane usher protein FimD/PapC
LEKERKPMIVSKVTRSVIFCAAALIAIPLVASARPKSENTQVEKKTIQLDTQATVDGKTLMPGKYEVLIDGNKVSFDREGHTLATARCDWKTLSYKSQYNSTTLSAKHSITELEFQGSNRALEVM